MPVLLIDLGNTRVKWSSLTGGRLARQRAAAHANWTSADFGRALCATVARGTPAIVASVASGAVNARLARALRRALGTEPRFVRTRRRAAGVTTRYREPWRLGVDRWVAVVGAHHLFRPARPVIVADIGTAMTVDLVDALGCHRGGVIVPGPDLMIASLLAGTSGIGRRASARARSQPTLFARDTRAALERGAEHAAAALVEHAAREATALLGTRVRIVLTGGAAPRLRRSVRSAHEMVADLVLRGLAVLHASNERAGTTAGRAAPRRTARRRI